MIRSLVAPIAALLISVTALAAPQVSPRMALARKLPEINLNAVALSDALDFLRDTSAANIHVNWRALENAGIGKDTPISVRLRGASLRKVLNIILTEAAGGADVLSFYSADGVLEITTRELADADMITRLYPIEDLLMEVPDFNNAPDFNIQQSAQVGGGGGGSSLFGGGGGEGESETTTRAERAEALIQLIQDTIQPDIWADNGGTATIRFFNGSLVVRAPRSVHEALGGPVD